MPEIDIFHEMDSVIDALQRECIWCNPSTGRTGSLDAYGNIFDYQRLVAWLKDHRKDRSDAVWLEIAAHLTSTLGFRPMRAILGSMIESMIKHAKKENEDVEASNQAG